MENRRIVHFETPAVRKWASIHLVGLTHGPHVQSLPRAHAPGSQVAPPNVVAPKGTRQMHIGRECGMVRECTEDGDSDCVDMTPETMRDVEHYREQSESCAQMAEMVSNPEEKGRWLRRTVRPKIDRVRATPANPRR